MALNTITFGKLAQSEDVNPIIRLLQGTSGTTQSVQLIQQNDATAPSLTVKNLSTTDGAPAFVMKDASGTDSIVMRRTVAVGGIANYDSITVPQLVLKNGAKLAIDPGGSGGISRANLFTIGSNDSDPKRVMELLYYTNNSVAGASPPPDVASSAIIIDSGSGDAYCRALEVDMLARGGSGFTWPKLGIELSIESNSAGNGSDETVGIAIHNYFDAWFGGSSVAVDTALLIGRDNAPFTNFIRVMGNDDDGNTNTVLFNLDRDGTVNTGSVVPLTDSVWQLGTLTKNWAQSWVDTYFSTKGIGSDLHYSLGATSTGLFLPASNAVAIMNNGTESLRIDASGNVIVGTTQIATNATDGFLLIRQGAGAPTGTPTVGAGRAALYVDSTNHKFYFHDGSGWIVTN